MKSLSKFLAVLFLLVAVRTANADLIPFIDDVNYWQGWGNTDGDNVFDSIGIPNFTDGTATVTSGILTNLTFNRQPLSSTSWSVLSPGDLFLDIGADNDWDYVVDITNWPTSTSGAGVTDPVSGFYQLRSVNIPLADDSGLYIKSGTDNTNGWSGYLIRDNHPVAANIGWLDGGTINFTGWGDATTIQYAFDFGSGLNLGPSGSFNIGWGVNCANDMLYNTIPYGGGGPPVPEPATMSLLGLGLFGLLGLRKRSA
jgi:hypothetical protein